MTAPAFQITWIPLEQLREADWNANRVPPATLKKIRTSIETFGIVENLVVRELDTVTDIPVTQPVPTPGSRTLYEVVSGNHRLQLYRELHINPAPCHITTLDRPMAIILGEALNHVRGSNDPDAYNTAIRAALAHVPPDTVTALINETRESLAKIMGEAAEQQTQPRAFQHRYELVIECDDEAQQEQLYGDLSSQGLTCRILTL